jgi:hypothetical protein
MFTTVGLISRAACLKASERSRAVPPLAVRICAYPVDAGSAHGAAHSVNARAPAINSPPAAIAFFVVLMFVLVLVLRTRLPETSDIT